MIKRFIMNVHRWLKDYRIRIKKIRDAGGVTQFLRNN